MQRAVDGDGAAGAMKVDGIADQLVERLADQIRHAGHQDLAVCALQQQRGRCLHVTETGDLQAHQCGKVERDRFGLSQRLLQSGGFAQARQDLFQAFRTEACPPQVGRGVTASLVGIVQRAAHHRQRGAQFVRET